MQSKLIILRENRNINQETMADLLGISVKQYNLKENGEAKFDGDEMFKIANYFKLKLDEIFLSSYHQTGDIKCNLFSNEKIESK